MRRKLTIGLCLCVAAVLVTACGDEGPTQVGGDLMGSGVRTFEVNLEAEDFLVSDTTFDRIGSLNDAEFRMAAHAFEGELDARTLFSVTRPVTVTWSPEDNGTVTDTIEAFMGGVLTLVVDTVASSGGPIDLEVLQVGEEWDRASATWDVRIDTADVAETWASPGGSPVQLLATASWESGDTLRIPLDSAAVAVWDDSLAARIGGLVRATTPDRRLFIQSMSFRYDVVPVDADTIVPAGSIRESKIIATPDTIAPAPGELRVGGMPAWRSALRFRPLADLRIPCGPGQPPDCTVALEEVTVNLAALLLEPLPAGARRIERPMRVEGRAILAGPGVPLVRSPLAALVDPPSDTLAVTLFAGTDPAPGMVRLPLTTFVQIHIDPDSDAPAPEWLALTAAGERTRFGFAAFGGLASNRPPRLRLVVSVPDDVLIR